MRLPFFLGMAFIATLFIVSACKARKEAQKENNSPPDSNLLSSGKTGFSTDTLPNLFTIADKGKKIALKKNDAFNLLLEANITTGYSWVIANTDSALLKKVAENYFPDSNPQQAVGVGGKQWYSFKTVAPGTIQLKLAYKRPWETNETPASTFELEIEVKEK